MAPKCQATIDATRALTRAIHLLKRTLIDGKLVDEGAILRFVGDRYRCVVVGIESLLELCAVFAEENLVVAIPIRDAFRANCSENIKLI